MLARLDKLMEHSAKLKNSSRLARQSIGKVVNPNVQEGLRIAASRIYRRGSFSRGASDIRNAGHDMAFFYMAIEKRAKALAALNGGPTHKPIEDIIEQNTRKLILSDTHTDLHELRKVFTDISIMINNAPHVVDAFYSIEDIKLDWDPSSIDYIGEVGGGLRYRREGNTLFMTPYISQNGTRDTIRLWYSVEKDEAAQWHCHPSKDNTGCPEPSFPIPSANDLLEIVSGMLFGTYPNAIICEKESRLYLPDHVTALVSPKLRQKLTRYNQADRKREILERIPGYSPSGGQVNMPMPNLHYIELKPQQ